MLDAGARTEWEAEYGAETLRSVPPLYCRRHDRRCRQVSETGDRRD